MPAYEPTPIHNKCTSTRLTLPDDVLGDVWVEIVGPAQLITTERFSFNPSLFSHKTYWRGRGSNLQSLIIDTSGACGLTSNDHDNRKCASSACIPQRSTDDKYSLYNASLKEIARIEGEPGLYTGQGLDGDDKYFEGITLSVREMRAWVRGRYSTLSWCALAITIGRMLMTPEQILGFFSLNLPRRTLLPAGSSLLSFASSCTSRTARNWTGPCSFSMLINVSHYVQLVRRPRDPHPRASRPRSHPRTDSQFPPQQSQHPASVPPQQNPFAARPKPPPRSEDGPALARGPPLPP